MLKEQQPVKQAAPSLPQLVCEPAILGDLPLPSLEKQQSNTKIQILRSPAVVSALPSLLDPVFKITKDDVAQASSKTRENRNAAKKKTPAKEVVSRKRSATTKRKAEKPEAGELPKKRARKTTKPKE